MHILDSMDKMEGAGVLTLALTPEEKGNIPSEICKKIEDFVSAKFDELLTGRALAETSKFTTEQTLTELQKNFETISNQLDEFKSKYEATQQSIAELEAQLSTTVEDNNKLQTSLTNLELETAELRRQRNAAVDERDDLSKMVERRNGEVERLQADVKALTSQLEKANATKYEALAKFEEVESMKFSIEHKEKRMDQERTLMQSQIESLTQELQQRNDEFLNLRRDNTLRSVQLDVKLTEKIQELNGAQDRIKTLTDVNNALTARAEELHQKLSEEKETLLKTQESFQHELDVQVKLAELYKGMCEEKTKHIEELTKGCAEIKARLDDAIEKYGDLETQYKEAELAHVDILEKKTECINVLKRELEVANEELSSRNDISSSRLAEMCPTGSAIPSSSRPGTLTMTQMMTEIHRLKDDVADKTEEVNKLQAYINQIQEQLKEKAPLIIRQREEYEMSLQNIEELTKHNEVLLSEIQQLREDMAECRRSEGTISRENERLKRDVLDLSRQVCHLLKEVDSSRVGGSSNASTDMSDSQSSEDIINKNLVLFNDLPSLISMNQKLKAIVRELSARHEEAEQVDPAAIADLQMKMENMKKTHAELLEEQERSARTINSLFQQRDLYKNLFLQCKKGGNLDIQLPEELRENQSATSNSSKENMDTETSPNEDKLQEVEEKLEKAQKEITLLKEENETYKKEKTAHERILVEQMDKMRSDMQALSAANARLTAKCESNDELFKTLKLNTDVYKKQAEKAEERNRIYSETIAKHETTINYLRDQVLQAQTKLTKSEVMLRNLEKENALLKDAESRYMKERDSLQKEKHSHSVLFSNIELIKATLERKDAESKLMLEEQLKDAHRELAALRRRLQEEQDRFRQLTTHLEKKTQKAEERMEEEKQQADKLRKELIDLREDCSNKTKQVEDLTKKLKSSLLAGTELTPDSKKFKELQKSYEEGLAEITALHSKLKASKEAVAQHMNVAEASEKQLAEVIEQANTYKKTIEEKLAGNEKIIAQLKEKIDELEGELSLSNDGQEDKLKRLESSNKTNTTELFELKKDLDAARKEIMELTENLKIAEEKYTREMMLHSADLQAQAVVKEELMKAQQEINEVKHLAEQAQQALEENKAGWSKREELYKKEKEDVEKRLKDLDSQNTLLLDQLQNLNTQLSVIQVQALTESSNTSMAESSMNRSFLDDDGNSSDQLMKIIRYLRQEKDIAISKCEILEAEHNRMKTQQDLITRQMEEAKAALESERQKAEVTIVSAAKHAEVLRKVETLNAITDSNRALRLERDNLMTQVKELKARTTSLEEQLAPQQEKNRELTAKAEAMQTEIITLRSDATRWRQRANILIEKSNRTSPEDWKKLQNERENLAKQLTIERANMVKVNDEFSKTKVDKARLDDMVKQLKQQLNEQSQELSHVTEELGALRAQVMNLNEDLARANSSIAKLGEENKAMKADEEAKTVSFNELKNNLGQVKKIAKKYRTQCEEQQKEIEALKQQIEQKEQNETLAEEKQEQLRQEGRTQLEERIAQIEQTHNERVTELNNQITSLTEAAENYKKEIENVKQTSIEKEERFKNVFKNCKERIVALQDQLNNQKSGNGEKSGSSSDSQGEGSDITQLQAVLDRVEREKEEILAEKQRDKEKYAADLESYVQKINNLQRQLGLQQGIKPSTSSGPIEKANNEPPTANIKPMAGHSNTQTQAATIQPWRSGGEPPLASIRPMSMQIRTVAVPPTSQSPSAAMIPPQQQVHTTGSSNVEAMSSSPTSSHTDYAPATSSASSALGGPRQVAVPPTQSNQDTEDEDVAMQGQPANQQQTVAMVTPRVEPPTSGSTQDQGTSSTSSSNTVTTTQAGLKRPREADTDSSCQSEEPKAQQQQSKRTRLQAGATEAFQSVSESGLEVEYQVPTSSQRDHEEEPDAVVVIESDDEGDVPDEGEGADDDPDDADTEGYDMDGISYPEQEAYDDDCQEVNLGNEVEVIEDSSEVPNQSERSQEAASQEESTEQPQSEAISSGTDGNSGVTVSQASTSVAVTMPSLSRTRQVAPLSRNQQSHLLLPHGLDEGGDDGIVPSTPTLFVPRRSDGFGEAVSSPHVPTISGRFTFNEPGAQSNSGSNEVIPEQTLEMSNLEDNSTGRSVPTTPLQASPQEYRSGSDETQSVNPEDIPTITVSSEEVEQAPEASTVEMGPPSIAGTSSEQQEQGDDLVESEDGVTSEGEKPPATEEGEEEGREAEASPSTNTRSTRSNRGSNTSRRAMRHSQSRGVSRSGPTPITWSDQSRTPSPRQDIRGMRGSAGQSFSPRPSRRSRGRTQRPYGRF